MSQLLGLLYKCELPPLFFCVSCSATVFSVFDLVSLILLLVSFECNCLVGCQCSSRSWCFLLVWHVFGAFILTIFSVTLCSQVMCIILFWSLSGPECATFILLLLAICSGSAATYGPATFFRVYSVLCARRDGSLSLVIHACPSPLLAFSLYFSFCLMFGSLVEWAGRRVMCSVLGCVALLPPFVSVAALLCALYSVPMCL